MATVSAWHGICALLEPQRGRLPAWALACVAGVAALLPWASVARAALRGDHFETIPRTVDATGSIAQSHRLHHSVGRMRAFLTAGKSCISSAVNGRMMPPCLDRLEFSGASAAIKQRLPAHPKLASYDAPAISYYFAGWKGSFIDIRGYSQNDAAHNDYGDPFYFGHPTDPVVTIKCRATWAPCYGHPYRVHIPAKARATGGSDHHMTVIEPNGTEYDWWEFPIHPGARDIVNDKRSSRRATVWEGYLPVRGSF